MQKAVFNTAVSRVITTYFKKREGSRVDDFVVKRVKKKNFGPWKKTHLFLALNRPFARWGHESWPESLSFFLSYLNLGNPSEI